MKHFIAAIICSLVIGAGAAGTMGYDVITQKNIEIAQAQHDNGTLTAQLDGANKTVNDVANKLFQQKKFNADLTKQNEQDKQTQAKLQSQLQQSQAQLTAANAQINSLKGELDQARKK